MRSSVRDAVRGGLLAAAVLCAAVLPCGAARALERRPGPGPDEILTIKNAGGGGAVFMFQLDLVSGGGRVARSATYGRSIKPGQQEAVGAWDRATMEEGAHDCELTVHLQPAGGQQARTVTTAHLDLRRDRTITIGEGGEAVAGP